MAAILRSRRSFKPEVVPKFGFYIKIGHAHPYHISFCSTFYLKNWRSYGDFKIWPTFWPRDLVIWPSTYKKYTPMWWTRFHMWTKFRVNWSKTATCIAFQTNRQTNKQTNKQMKGQSKIAYLPKFPKMITNLMMIMTWMLMIKNILKFKIVIMILPIIMTHLRKYTLLYHVPWYHCSKQELRRNRSNSRCDAIDDITILHSV